MTHIVSNWISLLTVAVRGDRRARRPSPVRVRGSARWSARRRGRAKAGSARAGRGLCGRALSTTRHFAWLISPAPGRTCGPHRRRKGQGRGRSTVRLEVGVGAELVGGVPEALFEFGDIGGHGWSLTGDRRRGGFAASWLLFGHGHHSYRNDQTIPPRRSR